MSIVPSGVTRIVDRKLINYACGCVNGTDIEWGVLRSVHKCRHHLKAEEPSSGRGYYEKLGCFGDDGIPLCAMYIHQMESALGKIPHSCDVDCRSNVALEIGCGASMYAGHLLRLGWNYIGQDIDQWGCRWISGTYRVQTIVGSFPEEGEGEPKAGLLLSAHCLEHLKHAPNGLVAMFRRMVSGAHLYLLVPDDTDPVNPDHLWFFTEETLARTVEKVGFKSIVVVRRQIVEREGFLYCHAVRP